VVRALTDEVGPRPAGSEGFARAAAWAVLKMNDAALSNVHAEDVKVTPWIRVSESAEIVWPAKQRLAMTALGGSVSTPEGGIEGEIVEAESLDALGALSDDVVRGKIVLVNVTT